MRGHLGLEAEGEAGMDGGQAEDGNGGDGNEATGETAAAYLTTSAKLIIIIWLIGYGNFNIAMVLIVVLRKK